MPDRGKVIKGLDICANGGGCKDGIPNQLCPYSSVVGCDLNQILLDALALLKEQDNEEKRIMKIIWDTLHEGVSIDTVPDQDWVYELIRHRIEDR